MYHTWQRFWSLLSRIQSGTLPSFSPLAPTFLPAVATKSIFRNCLVFYVEQIAASSNKEALNWACNVDDGLEDQINFTIHKVMFLNNIKQ